MKLSARIRNCEIAYRGEQDLKLHETKNIIKGFSLWYRKRFAVQNPDSVSVYYFL